MSEAGAGLADRSQALRALHGGPAPLVLPNCWDVASARRFAESGAPVVATSSAAVAEALGWADHQAMPGPLMLEAVARIAAAVDRPLTADLEAGYGLSAGELVDGLLAAGAVGLNLEDTDHDAGGLRPLDWQVQRITAVRAAADAHGVGVVLNARVDVHIHGASLEEGLERARAYRAAGADCVYPILLTDEAAIARYVEVAGVVNVLGGGDGPSLSRLAALGVARASFGPRLWRAALAAAEAMWHDFAPKV